MLQELLEDAGYETRSYSGRGMYGMSCLAIVTDDSLAQVCCNVFRILVSDIVHEGLTVQIETLEQLECVCQDDMGLSQVYYWPKITYEENVT